MLGETRSPARPGYSLGIRKTSNAEYERTLIKGNLKHGQTFPVTIRQFQNPYRVRS